MTGKFTEGKNVPIPRLYLCKYPPFNLEETKQLILSLKEIRKNLPSSMAIRLWAW